ELAAEMIVMGERAASLDEARAVCRRVVADGSALERFHGMVAAQGGNPDFLRDPSGLPAPRRRIDLPAPRTGVVLDLAARPIGQATMLLGAGRARVDSSIDPSVGVILHKKVGAPVREGEPLCTILVNDESRLGEVSTLIAGAYTISDEPAIAAPLI